MAVRMTKAQAAAAAKQLGQETQLGLVLDGKPIVKNVPAKKLTKQKSKPRIDYADIFVSQMQKVAPELAPIGRHDRKARNELRIQPHQFLTEFYFVDDRNWRIDAAAFWARLAIEVDGGRWAPGGGRHAGDSDKEKRNRLAMEGWLVLVYSKDMLMNDPDRVALEIRATLAQRGVVV